MNPQNREKNTAIVIGGGVVGLCCALQLQAAGLSTTLVGPRDPDAASWGNAGHIAVEQVEPLASLSMVRSLPQRLFSRGGAASFPPREIGAWLPFGLRLLRASGNERFRAGTTALTSALQVAMPAWRRLVSSIGRPDLLLEAGHLVVWESEASAAAGKARWQASNIGETRIREATAQELSAVQHQVECSLSGGIRFSGSGQIADLVELADILDTIFMARAGLRREAWAAAVEPKDGGVVVRLTGGEIISADCVIVAAGARSGALLEPCGSKVPMIAERGYHIQTAASDWPTDLPPVVFEDRSMIITRFRSGLRAASFVEFGRAESPPYQAKWARLRAHAADLGFSFPEPISVWMGARPTLPDYLPAIGHSRRVPGLFYAFGHQHLGLTLAAATGEAMRALVEYYSPPFDLGPFDLERFE